VLIAVTGASGFIGCALCAELVELTVQVCGSVRNLSLVRDDSQVEFVAVRDIAAGMDWSSALADFDCVNHCAAFGSTGGCGRGAAVGVSKFD
jgi:nucleoside-diphosphate-sugar epimerase